MGKSIPLGIETANSSRLPEAYRSRIPSRWELKQLNYRVKSIEDRVEFHPIGN